MTARTLGTLLLCSLSSLLVITGVAGAACGGGGGAPGAGATATADAGAGPGDAEQPDAGPPIPVWDDATALSWMNLKCLGCHRDAYLGLLWPNGELTRTTLDTSELTAVAYQTMLHRLLGKDGFSPLPMPTNKPNEADLADLRAILAWFERVLPLAVAEADGLYGNDTSTRSKVALTFTCSTSSTLRQHLGRFYLGALDRPASAAELAKYTTAELGAPVTPAQRLALVGLLDTTLKAEFVDSGLRKLAQTIGGGPDAVNPPDGLGAAAVADLREELFQLMKAKYDTFDYDKYFTGSTVMVSANTAALYAGCTAPAAGAWASCALAPPRNGYFTTVGFLSSTPTNFMEDNNNYGRVSGVSLALYGASPASVTSGPAGDAVPPLPTCLESTDTRAYQGAPRGAAAVPMFGQVCQTCHVRRNLAAGAVVLRTFASNGSIFDPATLGAPGSADLDEFTAQTTDPGWSYTAGTKKPVDGPFLRSLLTASLASPGACVAKGGTSTLVPLGSIADLAAPLAANKTGMSRGFMRHAQRAFSQSPKITLEMVYRAAQVYDGTSRRLPDLVRAYFMSDTFACAGP